MATPAFLFPRKIDETISNKIKTARVNVYCAVLWDIRKRRGRLDTFIGLIDVETWTFFIAPCFGIAPGLVRHPDPAKIGDMISRGEFPGDTLVKSNATSSSNAAMVAEKKQVVEQIYGPGNVCYTELDAKGGFDGRPHKALWRWVNNHVNDLQIQSKLDWFKLLGFAIQRDNDGFYVRFASTLNEFPGQTEAFTRTFAPKPAPPAPPQRAGIAPPVPRLPQPPATRREPRDLPKSWSQFVESVLARDLRLSLISRENIKSRNETDISRLTRFTPTGAEGGKTPLQIPMRLV